MTIAQARQKVGQTLLFGDLDQIEARDILRQVCRAKSRLLGCLKLKHKIDDDGRCNRRCMEDFAAEIRREAWRLVRQGPGTRV